MRKTVLFLLILLSLQMAAGFPLQIQEDQRTAINGEPAEFTLKGSNSFPSNRSFRISSIESVPKASNWFSHTSQVKAAPGENFTIKMNVTPGENAIQGNYGFTVNVRTIEGDNLESRTAYFAVDSKNDLSITSYNTETGPFRPDDSIEMNLTIINTASEPVEGIGFTAKLLNQKTNRQGFSLPPGAELTQQLKLRLPINASPGQKNLELGVTREGEQVENITQSITVEEVTNVEKTSNLDNRLLTSTKTLKAENKGNAPKKVRLNASIPSYVESLTIFSQEADMLESNNGEDIYYWSFELDQGETAEVSYTTRYWPPLLLTGFILLGLVAIRKIQSSIKIRKEAIKSQDGLKIRLTVENSSGSGIEKLEVKDFVPDIASVERKFEIARPVVRKTNDGTRLNWELEDLSPGEQRVLEYTIEPLYEVEGGVDLPSAEVVVDDEVVSSSGKVPTEFRP